MNKFENRDTQYPIRKELIIKNIEYEDNGELSKLLVDVERQEGEVYQEGTPLNAQTLNGIYNGMQNEFSEKLDLVEKRLKSIHNTLSDEITKLEKELKDLVCKKYYVESDCELLSQNTNYDQSPEFVIHIADPMDVEVVGKYNQDMLMDVVSNNDYTIRLKAYESEYLKGYEGLGSHPFDFIVTLKKKGTNTIVAQFELTVIYTYLSTTPED